MFKFSRSILVFSMSLCCSFGLFGIASATTVTTEVEFQLTDGAIPNNGSLLYSNQYIYGATYSGGKFNETTLTDTDLGVIFQMPAVVSATPVTPTVIYEFNGPDGAHPNGSLVADASGNLYGTTQAGGDNNFGTVFKLTNPHASGGIWALTTLHSFTYQDGAPEAGVSLGSDGSIYGTTVGHPDLAPPYNAGTVFEVAPGGTFTTLHTFSGIEGNGDGGAPRSNLIVQPTGIIIGTTSMAGGVHLSGALWAIKPTGAFSIVYKFDSRTTAAPVGDIASDTAGNIFIVSGGYNLIEITVNTHQLVYLKGLTGGMSLSGVRRDNAGNLYGTYARTFDANGAPTGGGVFSYSPNGVSIQIATLDYSNEYPMGGVTFDPSGNLWATSSAGGSPCGTASNVTYSGCGTVFTVSP